MREENTFKTLEMHLHFNSDIKTITPFSVLKFVVGLSCYWCRFPHFTGVVCCSSPIRCSHVIVSRPCRLSEFIPNRVSFIWYQVPETTLLPSYPGQGNFKLISLQNQSTVYIKNANQSWGARQLGWASCLTLCR